MFQNNVDKLITEMEKPTRNRTYVLGMKDSSNTSRRNISSKNMPLLHGNSDAHEDE